MKRINRYDGDQAKEKVLSRISSEVSTKRDYRCFTKQSCRQGVYFQLCYFEPKSDLNPDHKRLYELNELTIVRQLHYSPRIKTQLIWYCS